MSSSHSGIFSNASTDLSNTVSVTIEESKPNSHIVPMPAWSSVLGCMKLILSIIVLGFTATCIAIWGSYPAFVFATFTASFTLLTFAYYLTALAYETRFYNRYTVLALESLGTICWLASMVLLIYWTQELDNEVREYGEEIYFHPARLDIPYSTSRVLALFVRSPHPVLKTKYDISAKLAGVSAGFAGVEFVLFSIISVVFAFNLHRHHKEGWPSWRDGTKSGPSPEDQSADDSGDTIESAVNTKPSVRQQALSSSPCRETLPSSG